MLKFAKICVCVCTCLVVISCSRNNCNLYFKSKALKTISCNKFYIDNITDLKTALSLDTLQLHAGEYGGLPNSVIELVFTERNLRIKDYQFNKTIYKQGTDVDSLKRYFIFYYDAACTFNDKNSTISLSYIKYEDMRGVPPDKQEYPGTHVYNVLLDKSKPDVVLVKQK